MIRRFAVTLLLCTPVLAQSNPVPQGDPMATSRAMSANQLGVLEYCQSKGYTDQAPIVAQKSLIARLPPSTGAASPGVLSTDAAEAMGRKGMMNNNGTGMPLSDMATRGNTTVDALCKQIGGGVTQTAAMFQSSGMPSMPTMPNGMPAMPGGMPQMPSGMPTMPSAMPTMPGAAR